MGLELGQLKFTSGVTKFFNPKIKTSLKVSAEMPSTVVSLNSLRHRITSKIWGNHATAELTDFAPTDFELLIDVEQLESRVWVERSQPHPLAALVMFYANAPAEDLPPPESFEFTLVVDRSGSMAGSVWNDAQQATEVFLRSLPKGCKFQIVSFGSSFVTTFKGCQPYTEENLKTASEQVQKWKADLGGTNILQPLEHVFNSSSSKGHPNRRVILITGSRLWRARF